MKILGMFGPGENPSAALLINGKLIALIEEERINRIKTSPNNLPINAAKECMKIAGIDINSINSIEYHESVLLSPGCASFDQFVSYSDRGNEFKKIINTYNFEAN